MLAGNFDFDVSMGKVNDIIYFQRNTNFALYINNFILYSLGSMTEPEVTRLLDELRAWCDLEYGRQGQIAKVLGVSKQQINHWIKNRSVPNLGYGLKIQAFLKRQKKKGRS